MNPKVDEYLSKATKWQDEMTCLRTIILACGLTEELKWGKLCYTFQEMNIVILQDFKQYFALLFFKGVLLSDPNGILVKTGEKTRVGRQIRFNNVDEIIELEDILKSYLFEAIELEKAGSKVASAKPTKLFIPNEFQQKLDELPALKEAFDLLTPGRQRGYLLYFSAAKQTNTRESRIEKLLPQILNGKGLNDR
ncbi:YdeI/OmpD-associated family protein [Mangrovibacterium lignilyticum]|uniref:YdeI/OmpD-associated family protein n=1 Tax=Mangrovibacterium lignilyticum TaxID=2668052 RepID=UPI0013D6AC25|nr:DUF1801 domain-containing protein [Mangrovibacterium lignilyticum]